MPFLHARIISLAVSITALIPTAATAQSDSKTKPMPGRTPTTVELIASENPSEFGEPVTFTATVEAARSTAVPTGTVTFFVDGTAQTTVPIDRASEAVFSTSSLPPGRHTVTASFVGDSRSFMSSDSERLTHAVSRDYIVLGADVGSLVIVQDARTRDEVFRFNAFAGFSGGVRVAAADLNGDFVPEIVVGTGAGGSSLVGVFDGISHAALTMFLAFPGVNAPMAVATGDVTGDGRADVIVAAPANGHVKAFDGVTGTLVRSYFAFMGTTGEVSVAAGDINGDGVDDVIVGAAINAHVKAFDGATNALLRSFFAYPGFPGGVNVAAADIDGDGRSEIVTGTGSLATHVKVFDAATLDTLASFFAFVDSATGVRVGAADVDGNGSDDILTTLAGPGGHVRIFDGTNFTLVTSLLAGNLPAGAGLFITGSR